LFLFGVPNHLYTRQAVLTLEYRYIMLIPHLITAIIQQQLEVPILSLSSGITWLTTLFYSSNARRLWFTEVKPPSTTRLSALTYLASSLAK
jgi:hypothetical protein